MIYVMGTFVPRKEDEFPHCDCVNRFMYTRRGGPWWLLHVIPVDSALSLTAKQQSVIVLTALLMTQLAGPWRKNTRLHTNTRGLGGDAQIKPPSANMHIYAANKPLAYILT